MKKKDISYLSEEQKQELEKLEKLNKKYGIKKLCCYTIPTLAFAISLVWANKHTDTRYIPFINEKVTYYSNDELTYSSLNHEITRLEKEDSSLTTLTNLESDKRLVLYSAWEKVGDIWCRTRKNIDLTEDQIMDLENLITENASLEEWQNEIDLLMASSEYIIESQETEPLEKQGYFEFKMIDDTSYEVVPSFSEKAEDISLFIFALVIIGGVSGTMLNVTNLENTIRNKEKMKKIIYSNKK